jgi:hypothetical protein
MRLLDIIAKLAEEKNSALEQNRKLLEELVSNVVFQWALAQWHLSIRLTHLTISLYFYLNIIVEHESHTDTTMSICSFVRWSFLLWVSVFQMINCHACSYALNFSRGF